MNILPLLNLVRIFHNNKKKNNIPSAAIFDSTKVSFNVFIHFFLFLKALLALMEPIHHEKTLVRPGRIEG